jgi:hypothetical protein
MTRLDQRSLTVGQLRQWAVAERVFAVIDACDAPAVPSRLRALGEDRAVSLYRGRAEDELWGIGPWLTQVDAETCDWIASDLWSTPWGIFAIADSDLETMRTHFRRFLVVKSPEGEALYFRYYDPRVLPPFLESCTEAELAELFGPIRAFAVTDAASYGLQLLLRLADAPADGAIRPKVVRR